MNITFLIGNGFDINLGLKTKYTEFLPYFLDNAEDNNMIKEWLKSDLKEDDDVEESLTQWSNLEIKLGDKLYYVTAENRDKFITDISELNILLAEYLDSQLKNFSTKDKEEAISEELIRSLGTFYESLPSKEKNSILDTQNIYGNEDFHYCFICFNYTDSLDCILGLIDQNHVIATHNVPHSSAKKKNLLGKLLHIHGITNEEMILGVNDIDQINNSFLKSDTEFLDTFIKSRMNESLAQEKSEQAKNIIANSHIIVIFGMSLGLTDKMWWEEIVAWLKKSENNKLLIYYNCSEDDVDLDRRLPAIIIPKNNQIKEDLLRKGGIDSEDPSYEKLKERIFISYDIEIFKFRET